MIETIMNSSLINILPELWLGGMASVILVLDFWTSRWSRWGTYTLCQITLIMTLWLFSYLPFYGSIHAFHNAFVLDFMGLFLKYFILVFAVFVFIYTRKYLIERGIYRSEYFVLGLFSILGMMILISAGSFLSLYLGVELIALPLYALIAIVRGNIIGSEAAIKYFVMGALASSLLLYGISLLYGVTGYFGFQEIAAYLAEPAQAFNMTLLLGMIFIFVGLAFKFGLVPFHLWLPDVYQGAPITVTLFIGTLPKIAAMGFAIRLLVNVFPAYSLHWQPVLMIMAVLSLAVGNIMAIAQTNLKRMLGFSTIAHMGFLALGLSVGAMMGYAAVLDYVIIYALMALGTFGVMTLLSAKGSEIEDIQDLAGLGTKNPWFAFLMLIMMLSLTGIPPFAGFYAKFFVLKSVIDSGYLGLAVFALLMTVVGAYYYLRIIRVMYFGAVEGNFAPKEIATVSHSYRSPEAAVLSFHGLLILLLGIFPAFLYNLCQLIG